MYFVVRFRVSLGGSFRVRVMVRVKCWLEYSTQLEHHSVPVQCTQVKYRTPATTNAHIPLLVTHQLVVRLWLRNNRIEMFKEPLHPDTPRYSVLFTHKQEYITSICLRKE